MSPTTDRERSSEINSAKVREAVSNATLEAEHEISNFIDRRRAELTQASRQEKQERRSFLSAVFGAWPKR